MAAIVYLDVDDEITSAAARIRALDEDRVALVLPLGSRLATSRINFRLLAREAEARGKRIEVITNDASARALAASAGLPTHVSVAAFEAPPAPPASVAPPGEAAGAAGSAGGEGSADGEVSADAARAAGSGVPRSGPPPADDDSPTLAMPVIRPPAERTAPVRQVGRRPPQRRGPVIAAVALVGALVLVLGTAAFTLLPNAEIVVVPASDTVGPLELNVTAQSGVTNPDPANLLVPAIRFTFDVEASESFPATGVNVSETAATGTVTFENCDTSDGVGIPKGSIVSTSSGVDFRTLGSVSLKKARLFPRQCDGANVDVEAVQAGPDANVAAGQINRIPDGFDPDTLAVLNEQPTTGGTHTETKFIQQSDIDSALAALDVAMAAELDDRIANATDVPEGTTLFPETRNLGESTPSVDPATLVGTDVAEFELGITAQGTVIGADPGPVATLAEARIRSAVDAGFRLVEDSIVIEPGTPIVAGSVITFPVTVRALEIRVVDGAALLGRVRGLGLPQARTILEAYGDVTITVWPDWVTTIPTLEGRATLEIKPAAGPSDGPDASPGGSTP